MKLTSPAFNHQGMIPAVYTCDSRDISPPLEWADVPDDAQSFSLIMEDPDAPAGTWVHWVVYNIPSSDSKLAENIPSDAVLPNGIHQGRNSWHQVGYGGPCPPSGVHRYFFKLYALDCLLKNEPGLSKEELLVLIKGHILEETQLIGRYQRAR